MYFTLLNASTSLISATSLPCYKNPCINIFSVIRMMCSNCGICCSVKCNLCNISDWNRVILILKDIQIAQGNSDGINLYLNRSKMETKFCRTKQKNNSCLLFKLCFSRAVLIVYRVIGYWIVVLTFFYFFYFQCFDRADQEKEVNGDCLEQRHEE